MLRNKGLIETYDKENVVVVKIGARTKRMLKVYRYYVLEN
jgi:hypothetical protein